MSQEDLGAISANTRVATGQLIVAINQQSSYLVSNVALAHYRSKAVKAILLHLDEQGEPLHALLPLLPDSLAHGKLCRVMWREQTIALSLHQALDEKSTFLQSLAALRYWVLEHPALYGLAVAQEAREAVTIIDPMPVTQRQHRQREVRDNEQTDHGY